MVDRRWCQYGVFAAFEGFALNRVSGRRTTGFVFRRRWRTNYPFSLSTKRRACGIIACLGCPSHSHVVVPYLPRDTHLVHDRAIVCAAMPHIMRSGLPSCSKQSRRLQTTVSWQAEVQSLGLRGARRGGFCQSTLWHDRTTSKHLYGNARSELAYVSLDHANS